MLLEFEIFEKRKKVFTFFQLTSHSLFPANPVGPVGRVGLVGQFAVTGAAFHLIPHLFCLQPHHSADPADPCSVSFLFLSKYNRLHYLFPIVYTDFRKMQQSNRKKMEISGCELDFFSLGQYIDR